MVNRFPSYVNGNGNMLWWTTLNTPTWFIGSPDNVGSNTGRAYGSGQGGDGPAAASSWKTYDYSGSHGWVAEALTVAESRGLCSEPRKYILLRSSSGLQPTLLVTHEHVPYALSRLSAFSAHVVQALVSECTICLSPPCRASKIVL